MHQKTQDLPEFVQILRSSQNVKILSKDPLVYTVSNLLSPEECQQYQRYVTTSAGRPMTQSNPPEISLDRSKLWPLPILSMAAGLPPALRLWQENTASHPTWMDLASAAVPNILLALFLSFGLAYGVVLPLLQSDQFRSSQRTSLAMALNQPEDFDLIRPLVERASVWSGGHPSNQWEAPVVTHYEPGAVFTRHNDASPTRGDEWRELGGQRLVTCLVYLNTLNGGGCTYFDQLSLAVTPQQGQALLFFPAQADSWWADDRTTHESWAAPTDKWIVQLFGRAQRVPPPLGIPDEFFGCGEP
jgi:2OG-Fe(II) oxygenase superfamily